MKKFKSIAALFLSAILCISSVAYADGYGYGAIEAEKIHFSELKYERYDVKGADAARKRAEELINKKADFSEIETELDVLLQAEIDSVTAYYLININAANDNSASNNKEKTEAHSIAVGVEEDNNKLFKKLYNSDYRADFAAWFGGGDSSVAASYMENLPSEKYYDLVNDEQELIEDYRNNIDFSDDLFTYTANDGTKYTLDEIVELVENAETTAERDVYTKLYETAYTKVMTNAATMFVESGEIFDKLVDVRRNIATERGHRDYPHYAYDEIYNRDYTPEDIKGFRENVKEVISKLYSDELGIMYAYPLIVPEIPNFTEDEVYEIVGKYIGRIGPEAEEAYGFMREYGYSDISASKTKETQGSAFTTYLPKYKSSYVFVSPFISSETNEIDGITTLQTLIHEFGHYNTIIHDETPDCAADLRGGTNIDVAEINSQGLELLYLQYYDSIFKKAASGIKVEAVDAMLNAVISGCMFDEWQEFAYNNPDADFDILCNKFVEIAVSYGQEMTGFEWMLVSHNFDAPMYYISYAVSAVAALDIWADSLEDREGAIDKYNTLCAMGEGYGFSEVLSKCEIDSVFEKSTMEKIDDAIRGYFGLDYADVDYYAWYGDAVIVSADFYEGIDDEYFRPEMETTREMFVDALGKMISLYDDVTITAEDRFSDTDSVYASWAADNKIVEGYGNGVFGGQDNVTREQLAVFLYRYFKDFEVEETEKQTVFVDADSISPWAKEAVLWCASIGLINGYDNGMFKPQNTATRAETAQLLYNSILTFK